MDAWNKPIFKAILGIFNIFQYPTWLILTSRKKAILIWVVKPTGTTNTSVLKKKCRYQNFCSTGSTEDWVYSVLSDRCCFVFVWALWVSKVSIYSVQQALNMVANHNHIWWVRERKGISEVLFIKLVWIHLTPLKTYEVLFYNWSTVLYNQQIVNSI